MFSYDLGGAELTEAIFQLKPQKTTLRFETNLEVEIQKSRQKPTFGEKTGIFPTVFCYKVTFILLSLVTVSQDH